MIDEMLKAVVVAEARGMRAPYEAYMSVSNALSLVRECRARLAPGSALKNISAGEICQYADGPDTAFYLYGIPVRLVAGMGPEYFELRAQP